MPEKEGEEVAVLEGDGGKQRKLSLSIAAAAEMRVSTEENFYSIFRITTCNVCLLTVCAP